MTQYEASREARKFVNCVFRISCSTNNRCKCHGADLPCTRICTCFVTTKCNIHFYLHLHLHPKTCWKLNYRQEFVSMHNRNNFLLFFKFLFYFFSFKYSPIVLFNLLTKNHIFHVQLKKICFSVLNLIYTTFSYFSQKLADPNIV